VKPRIAVCQLRDGISEVRAIETVAVAAGQTYRSAMQDNLCANGLSTHWLITLLIDIIYVSISTTSEKNVLLQMRISLNK